MNLLRTGSVFFLLCHLVFARSVAAEDPASLASPDSSIPTTAQSPSPSTTPTSTPAEKELPPEIPLGAWILPDKPQNSEGELPPEGEQATEVSPEDLEDEKTYKALLRRYEVEALERDQTPDVPVAIGIKRNVLTKSERKRIDRAEKLQRKAIKEHRLPKDETGLDSRGPAELRVCTLNLDNFSSKSEVERVLKTKTPKNFRGKEREIIQTLLTTRCDVVAVQGIVGTATSRAKAGLSALAEKLGARDIVPWEAHLGSSNHRLVYDGFLVRLGRIEVETIQSYVDTPLAIFDEYREKLFTRGPFEIQLKVKNRRNPNSIRHVRLLTFSFSDSLDSSIPTKESYRMQMGAALRRIALERQRDLIDDSYPLYIVLGDTAGSRFSPGSQVLEGRYQLDDFARSGSCKVTQLIREKPEDEEEETAEETPEEGEPKKQAKKAKKEPPPEYYVSCAPDREGLFVKSFFGISGEEASPPRGKLKREVDGKTEFVAKKLSKAQRIANQQRLIYQRSEIYLLADDLPYVYKQEGVPGRYAGGTVPLTNGIKQSPLVWVDINW